MPKGGVELRPKKIKLLHITPDLARGGSANVLLALLGQNISRGIRQKILTLSSRNDYQYELEELGVEVFQVPFDRLWTSPQALVAAKRILKKIRPHLIQTWLYKADFVGALLRQDGDRLIWSIHNGAVDADSLGWGKVLLLRLLARMSRRSVDRIISCSGVAAEKHATLGYAREKLRVIHNGFDGWKSQPDPKSREIIREAFGVRPGEFLVGHVGRPHSLKNYQMLAMVMVRCFLKNPKIKFLLVGPDSKFLSRFRERHPLFQGRHQEKIMILPPQQGLTAYYNGIDILVMTSRAEAFPMVLGEAMLCGKVCLSTNVGDVSLLISDPQWLVAPEDAGEMAGKILQASRLSPRARAAIGRRNRQVVMKNFSVEKMGNSYHQNYLELVGGAI